MLLLDVREWWFAGGYVARTMELFRLRIRLSVSRGLEVCGQLGPMWRPSSGDARLSDTNFVIWISR